MPKAKKKLSDKDHKKAIRSKRRLHKRILMHPAAVFIMLCVGVLLIGLTVHAAAEDIHVSAKIAATPPSSAATITSPADGTEFTTVPVTIKGTCPSDGTGAYIKLYRNGVFSGAAMCSATHTFTLDTDLFTGSNILMAKIFNSTDDPGPDSATITVYYNAPTPPPNATSSTPSSSGNSNEVSTVSATPFDVSSDYSYRGYLVNQVISWPISVSGGTVPYALNIDWGDGTSLVVSRAIAGTFNVSHKYGVASPTGGFIIKIKASDKAGDAASLQLFVIVVKGKPGIAGIGSTGSGNTTSFMGVSGNNWHTFLEILWPSYLIVLLMIFSFYLGERREFLIITKRHRHA